MGNPDTVAKTAPIAMHAVAQHMLDRRLPGPLSIDGPAVCTFENHNPRLPDRRVLIIVDSTALDAWLDSIDVDDQHARPVLDPAPTGYEVATYEGRIPTVMGDVAVAVKVVRRARTLTSVHS